MQRLLSALSTSKLRILGQALRSALSGGERDYTSGHLGWAVLILSVPMILEMLLQSVFELADIFFVSRLGAEADRKSTRLNSSHVKISYAVFCLKKKKLRL